MPYITQGALEVFEQQASELTAIRHERHELRETIEAVGMMVLAAARQGFKTEEQRQALFFALEKLSGESYLILKLILDVTVKDRKGNSRT